MAFKLKGSHFYGSPFKQSVPKPKKSKTSAHGQLDDAQAEYETDKKLYEASKNKKAKNQGDFEPAYEGADYSQSDIDKMTKKQKESKIDGYDPKLDKSKKKTKLKDLRSNDKNVDLDKGADMPVKKGGFGPRRGNVPNPEMQGRTDRPKQRKVMKDGYVNPTQKKKMDDRKADYDKLSPAEKKASQDAANAKRKAFEATPEYKKRRAEADAKMKEANKNR